MSVPIEQTKTVLMCYPELVSTSAAWSTNVGIDTKGYSHLRVLLTVGATDKATSAAPALAESTALAGTYTAITSPVTAALSAAIGATDDGNVYSIDVDLTQDRERYIKCLVTCAASSSAGTNLAIIGILSKPNFGTVDTDAGLEELISA